MESYSERVDEIFPRFKALVDKLKGLDPRQRSEEEVAEYYLLDRQLSQLMEHGCVSAEQQARVLPVWREGANGLYQKFPERRGLGY